MSVTKSLPEADYDWLAAVRELRARREPCVIVTLAGVRGHSPRNAGAKMIVSSGSVSGTVGGGNLEATTIARARSMIAGGAVEPAMMVIPLNDKVRTEYGRQCCGGEVTIMLEPVRVPPTIAIFGVGHVGIELARILSRHEIDLFLVDSREDMLTGERLAPIMDGPATIEVRNAPVPESVLAELPASAHVVIMTHDHAEDIAVCDAALRRPDLASIGLIGSSAKWARFQVQLRAEGHGDDDLARITTPIGRRDIAGKDPAAIAVGVAAELLAALTASSVG
ncbi:xanthine dehydrogenase accessory protein XdhC [Spelaeicoccus albus]|uniref:Xanthine dehydrogenase accessory factor n=1 Tax=Spelaeicoccus albus TaxID=1280376 RepID=A0A7Z0ACF1_9MICO|nr:xanthine dehydrogenase accessory protein XdhC [Spelaeicoccus albus]NYI67370.1 xanthine dehydrogenase accessory factor [Spelaeicoccus albus]